MLKVLIADDEKWVCEMIVQIVDWEDLGLQLTGQVEDGLSAFEFIRTEKPDIVITDIRMPGIDGIELVRKTRDLNMDTHFIIISGFRHFEYAHTALKYGVDDYLLKPIKKIDINKVLDKIRHEIVEKANRSRGELAIRETLTQRTEKLGRQFIDSVLNGKSSPDSDSTMDQVNAEYGFTFSHGIFRVIIFHLDKKSEEGVDARYNLSCRNELADILTRLVKPGCLELQSSSGGYKWIINYPAAVEDVLWKEIRHAKDEFAQYLDILQCYSITVGIGRKFNRFGEIAESIRTAVEAVRYRIIQGTGKVLLSDSLNLHVIDAHDVLPSSRVRDLANSMEILDTEKTTAIIHEIITEIGQLTNINPEIFFSVAAKIEEIFSNAVGRIHIDMTEARIDPSNTRAGPSPAFEMPGPLHIDLTDCVSVPEIERKILGEVTSKLTEYRKILDEQNYAPIRLGKKYISEHYHEPINLNDISKVVNLNPVYYSVVFKKRTGMNIIEYIQNYRLEISKDLLKNSRFNIAQVSEMVGYSDPKYFSRLFRKYVGINPAKFRKIHL